jgi:hypothetical protein
MSVSIVRGLRQSGKPGGEERRRFAGIDIDGERHAVAVVDEAGLVLVKSTFSGEDAEGYRRVRDLLGDQHNCRWRWRRRDTIGATCSPSLWDMLSGVTAESFYVRDASPKRNLSGRKPTRLMHWVSRGSQRRSGPSPRQ